jgi:methylated-DNA-[protein]-cysteine S-methyltransferase
MPVRDPAPDVGGPSRRLLVIVPSRFGNLAIEWSRLEGVPGVDRILLPGELPPPGAGSGSCDAVDDLAGLLKAFLDGVDVVLPLEAARLERCRPFQRAVLTAEYGIPRGLVSTYSAVAVRAGAHGAARAAGTALATNPFPILVPCHRAVRADGSIGGYRGGPAMKKALLELEGVSFDARGRVDPACFFSGGPAGRGGSAAGSPRTAR